MRPDAASRLPRRLVHEIRLDRGRPAVLELELLLLLAALEVQRRRSRAARGGGAAARGTAPRAASRRAPDGARARRASPRPCAAGGGSLPEPGARCDARRGGGRGRAGAAGSGTAAPPGEQAVEGHGLADEPGGAELLGARAVRRRRRAAGEQQHRRAVRSDARAARSASSTAKPSRFGSSTSRVTRSGRSARTLRERALAVVGGVDVVALRPERPRQDLAVAPVGVDAENPTRHASPPNALGVRIVHPRRPT